FRSTQPTAAPLHLHITRGFTMQYRTLGRTGLRVSEVGYGGGRVNPNQDRRALVEMLHAAFAAGLNYLDTAPDYGGGFSEIVIGEAVKGQRDGCIIATKTEDFDPEGIIADLEGSLKRLGVDVIDVLQFHGGWFSEEETRRVLDNGGLETYQRIRDQGKVRFLGFSADGPSAGVERMIATGEFDVMQIHYNLMYQSTCDAFGDRGVIPDAKRQGMGIVLMRSTTSGAFPKLMRHCFGKEMEGVDLDGFLLNFVLSNPMVDSALMSLKSVEDVTWANAVSDDVDARLDLREIYKR
ncbi:MAG: aldo/keto reductase, partial [Candidatus Poribacteria bacterium]|nr:aldo/keto reductase [Candidatus Poribacteria bacterium]